ncbi:MAG: hypothetical protein NWS71_11305 [Opitutales bacterium]|jgi:hypothetical protein|nr:hypothetical protein [Opitutales bacterium]MDP4883015.1 hypothetical protein [Opitutales bacterium]
MQYGDPHRRTKGLPFQSDNELLARLQETSYALSQLKEAVDLCHDQDMRTEDVYNALAFMRSSLKSFDAINGFAEALGIQNAEQRQKSLEHHLKRMIKDSNN